MQSLAGASTEALAKVWDVLVASVAANRRGDVKRVGVCFCGASVIGKDLKKHCRKYSSLERDLIFKLHKENF